MPQNTPMKRQFITIDGRTIMSNLPQHWGGNDWAITGVDNPLPVGNYVQTEAGIWIPQKGSDDGAADVRLTGSNVEEGLLVKTKGKVLIKQQLNVKISAGGAAPSLWSNVDITEFSDLQFAIRTDSTHNFLMRTDFEVMQYTFGPAIEYGNVIFSNIDSHRKFSEKIVAKGDLLKLYLENKDTADHYYDIYLWGFR